MWSQGTAEQAAAYAGGFEEDYALSGALNWYRGSLSDERMRRTGSSVGDIHTPTLFIWGNGDQAIGRRSTELAADFMKGDYKFIELDAGHWLIQEKPTRSLSHHRPSAGESYRLNWDCPGTRFPAAICCRSVSH